MYLFSDINSKMFFFVYGFYDLVDISCLPVELLFDLAILCSHRCRVGAFSILIECFCSLVKNR
jgi:hypothetical protein